MTERERIEQAARAYMDEDPVPQCADEDDFVDRMTGFALAQRQAAARECWQILDDWGKNRGTALVWKILGQPMREIRSRYLTPTEPPDRCPHGNPGNYPDCCYPTEPGGDERG